MLKFSFQSYLRAQKWLWSSFSATHQHLMLRAAPFEFPFWVGKDWSPHCCNSLGFGVGTVSPLLAARFGCLSRH